MNKCSERIMRNCMLAAAEFKNAGIEFVPMPVLNEKDRQLLFGLVDDRLEILSNEIELADENNNG